MPVAQYCRREIVSQRRFLEMAARQALMTSAG
jgi:hypothetical protein